VSIVSVTGTCLGSLGYNTTNRIEPIISPKAQGPLANIALGTVTGIIPNTDGLKCDTVPLSNRYHEVVG
jgi:hypothetical protein